MFFDPLDGLGSPAIQVASQKRPLSGMSSVIQQRVTIRTDLGPPLEWIQGNSSQFSSIRIRENEVVPVGGIGPIEKLPAGRPGESHVGQEVARERSGADRIGVRGRS